jgi:predicted metal-dependent phosphoesterase TrpH
MNVKADLHVHTVYSRDSSITPKELVFYARKSGLNALAITDHNQIEGALKIAKEADFLIIPGTEVSSRNGHIVGLNLREPIPKGLTPEETVDKIHGAGGLAVAVHPFALLKGSLGKHADAKFDAIETINASAFPFRRSVNKAQAIAERFGLARVAGTDAHYGPEIGCAYTAVDAELRVEAIIEAVRKGLCQPFGKPVPLTLKLERTLRAFRRNFDKKL